MIDDFQKRLEKIDRESLKSYLDGLTAPCYESSLIRIAFSDVHIFDLTPLELYRHHFLLYHVLFQLQEEYAIRHRYLHIHFMRTFLLNYPDPGKCRFYDPPTGTFCLAETGTDGEYCRFHRKLVGETELDAMSEKYFYQDERNFEKMDEKTAAAFMDGAWEILNNFDAYRAGFEMLGLPEGADTRMIKRKFRKLAMKYHPDHGSESSEKFNEINRAYRLLMKLA